MSEEVHSKPKTADEGSLVAVTVTSAVQLAAAAVTPTATTISTATSPVSTAVTANSTVTVTSALTATSNTSSTAVTVLPAASGPPAIEHVRVKLTDNQLESLSHDELVRLWRVQDSFIDMLEAQVATNEERLWNRRERKAI